MILGEAGYRIDESKKVKPQKPESVFFSFIKTLGCELNKYISFTKSIVFLRQILFYSLFCLSMGMFLTDKKVQKVFKDK